MDWDDIWGSIFTIGFIALVLFIGYVICVDHTVQYYYIGSAGDKACAIGYKPWATDIYAYCNGDIGIVQEKN